MGIDDAGRDMHSGAIDFQCAARCIEARADRDDAPALHHQVGLLEHTVVRTRPEGRTAHQHGLLRRGSGNVPGLDIGPVFGTGCNAQQQACKPDHHLFHWLLHELTSSSPGPEVRRARTENSPNGLVPVPRARSPSISMLIDELP